MTPHTFDPDRAEKLEDERRYRWCSLEEFYNLVRPDPTETLADLGSGTGFYTDLVASRIGTVYAVDVQPEMHELYATKGVPPNVKQVTADIADLPFDDDELDGAISTMTYHEFATADSLAEVARVIRPGGKFCVVDWAAAGEGEAGPPHSERIDIGDALSSLSNSGFAIDRATTRTETFVIAARRLSG